MHKTAFKLNARSKPLIPGLLLALVMTLPASCVEFTEGKIAQQINTPAEDTWAVNYLNGIYQYVKHGHVLQFDGQRTRAVYALTDSLMKHNLVGSCPDQESMEHELKAIIQQYMARMTQDRLLP